MTPNAYRRLAAFRLRPAAYRLAAVLAAAVVALPLAQERAPSDLDAFMSRVLERRDDNWKKLQQYVLEERETLRMTGPGGVPLYGFRREYSWFPREGFFIRSPRRVDGVEVSEDDRRRAEDVYLERQKRREAARRARSSTPDAADDPDPAGSTAEDIVRQSFEPQFVSSANFLRFTFDPGQYALAGRERLLDREVLRIEYYPTQLFREGRTRPNRRLRERDDRIREKMNKVSLVTLWVDPAAHQILQYRFENVDLDFLPARAFVRVDGLDAFMRMGEPFAGVWLPAHVDLRFTFTLAIGEVSAQYNAEYYDYRLATTGARVVP